jgi:glyoxylase-like metal-dependent hydrolase (beta-lactamase superfamily II)/rhodanese-related sulfurtransferase
MIFEQYYLDCLSHASYLVGDETSGRAVVVDPQRDVAIYVRDAAEHGLTIERVIETHVHADFLSGHLELAAATGAVISFGEAADASRIDFDIDPLVDGQRLSLGDVTLEILATPGHTPESITVAVYERSDDAAPWGALTGDTLFVGDVGRPDLLSSFGVTADDLGRMLYHSLRDKLLPLPDAVRVFPAHGAGSACGKQLGLETSTTIGEQRAGNYALQPMTEEEFVAVVTDGQPTAPPYFAFDATLNRKARAVLDETAGVNLLTLDDVLVRQAAGAVVLDARDAIAFAAGHLVGSVNVGLEGRFAEYAGDVVHPDEDIVLVTEPGRADEARVRLTPSELAERRAALPNLQIVDVRNPGEVTVGMIPGARHMPLARLRASLTDLDLSVPTVTYCAGGYRSIAASSLLREQGFVDVSDLVGGYSGWAAAESPA